MAQVLNTIFLKDGLGGESSGSGASISESAIIVFNTVVSNPLDAISFSGFKKGQQHRSGKLLFLVGGIRANVHQDDTGISWIFDLEYSTRANSESADNEDPNTGTYRPEVKI